MAQDIQIFDVTVPRGGSAAAPQVFNIPFPPRIVDTVEFMIPVGVRGTVHFALGMANTRVIPSNQGGYIAGDGEVIRWPLERFPDTGAWQLSAFNTGGFPHTIQIRFLLRVVQPQAQVTPALLASSALSSV